MTAIQTTGISRKNSTEDEKSGNKIVGLECILFLSALAILVWYYQHFAYFSDEPADFSRSTEPFYFISKPLHEYGYLGVQIFWCISGYIFFWKYGEAIATRSISRWNFFQTVSPLPATLRHSRSRRASAVRLLP